MTKILAEKAPFHVNICSVCFLHYAANRERSWELVEASSRRAAEPTTKKYDVEVWKQIPSKPFMNASAFQIAYKRSGRQEREFTKGVRWRNL